jgi:hypothetical protein
MTIMYTTMVHMIVRYGGARMIGLAVESVGPPHASMAVSWLDWIAHLGHDVYAYPRWISLQQRACECRPSSDANLMPSGEPSRPSFTCLDGGKATDWRAIAKSSPAAALTYCVAKAWLLEHMPTFDLHFLPGSVAVNSTSMLEDVVAFALMADHAAAWSAGIPLGIRLAYILPYGSYHESRQNWRPLFFAKFFGLVANASSVEDAWGRLLAPNAFAEWTQHYWPASSQQAGAGNACRRAVRLPRVRLRLVQRLGHACHLRRPGGGAPGAAGRHAVLE